MAELIISKANERQKAMFDQMKIPLIEEMSVEKFEKTVIEYLDRHNLLSLSTCRDNKPRCTTLEYFNDGLTVYLFSEGGGKIGNLINNPEVAFTIHDPYDSGSDYFGASGIQVWATASMFKRHDNQEKADEIQKFYRHTEGLKKQGIYEAVSRQNFNVITIKPRKITYLDLRKGYRNIVWKIEGLDDDE